MCDTFIAPASDGLLFCKNSDREPNEAQAISRYPRRETKEKEVRVTYISIPQVPETNEVLVSRPFHMWGAEMGANEHGVVIGNEAVFTNVKIQKTNSGLTGMDMLRLALERTSSASQALQCITDLLEQYGQDANGGYQKEFFYHNSFLIADPYEHYILETAGKHWVAKKMEGAASISNGLTIRDDYDHCSESIAKRGKIDFAGTFRDKLMSYFARCDYRSALSKKNASGEITVSDAINILSSHGDTEPFVTQRSSMKSLCIHASGVLTPTQTTASMIVQLRQHTSKFAGTMPTVWFSGTPAPCISLFTPFYFGGKTLSGEGPHIPSAAPGNSLWWKGERLHRALLKDYSLSDIFKEERKVLQDSLVVLDSSGILLNLPIDELDRTSADMLSEHLEYLDKWYKDVSSKAPQNYPGFLYRMYRNKIDKSVNFSG